MLTEYARWVFRRHANRVRFIRRLIWARQIEWLVRRSGCSGTVWQIHLACGQASSLVRSERLACLIDKKFRIFDKERSLRKRWFAALMPALSFASHCLLIANCAQDRYLQFAISQLIINHKAWPLSSACSLSVWRSFFCVPVFSSFENHAFHYMQSKKNSKFRASLLPCHLEFVFLGPVCKHSWSLETFKLKAHTRNFV